MHKAIDTEYSARPLQVLLAFQQDSLPGMIHVKACSVKQVNEACQGLVGIYPGRSVLVPIKEMASLLQIKKQEVTPSSTIFQLRGSCQSLWAKICRKEESDIPLPKRPIQGWLRQEGFPPHRYST